MENIHNIENAPQSELDALTQTISKVFETEREFLNEAFEATREERGDNFDNYSLESLFSSDFFEMFRPETAIDPEQETWRRFQIQNINELCVELTEASDEEAKKTAAHNLIDYLVNVSS